jgi:two-component system cell cycle sensor histidine kinase/response regulator CckA
MKKPSEKPDSWQLRRRRIIGLGERSIRKSYYPKLQGKLQELALFRALLDQSSDIILLIRMPSGRIADLNQTALQLLARPRTGVIDRPIEGLLPAATVEAIRSLDAEVPASTDPSRIVTSRIVPNGGQAVDLEMGIRAVELNAERYAVVVGRDVTERRRIAREKNRLRSQLLQAQKMESIGTLAGGIAHDFNNLLMGILGRTSLMALEAGSTGAMADHIVGIETCVKTATDLTNQLLGVARGGKYQVSPTALNHLVKTSLDMFGRTRKEMAIHYKLTEQELTVAVDRAQIEQVLLNLFVNAWQAMPDGGDLWVETDQIEIRAAPPSQHPLDPGRYARISVTDSGVGIDASIIERIFDPFFTTKEMGRGTGLGLASAYGIVQNHQGHITVYSEQGGGATFNIYLPSIQAESGPPPETADRGAIPEGGGTILLVDDEATPRQVGRQMLKALGYTAVVADSGQAAVALFRSRPDAFDLVILDMIMPGMSGAETLKGLRRIRDDVKVLLSSGYSLNGQAADIMAQGCQGFLQKPYDLAGLSQAVRELVGGAPAAD